MYADLATSSLDYLNRKSGRRLCYGHLELVVVPANNQAWTVECLSNYGKPVIGLTR